MEMRRKGLQDMILEGKKEIKILIRKQFIMKQFGRLTVKDVEDADKVE